MSSKVQLEGRIFTSLPNDVSGLSAQDDAAKEPPPNISPAQVSQLLPNAWLTAKGSKIGHELQVEGNACFGMIPDISFKVSHDAFTSANPVFTRVRLDDDHKLLRIDEGIDCELGELEPRAGKVLSVLSREKTLSLQLLTRVSQSQKGWTTKQSKRKRRGTLIISICIILYGPLDLAQAVGSFASECGFNLQDPIGPVLDVVYKNPHLLSLPGEQMVTTSSLLRHRTAPIVDAFDTNPLKVLDSIFSDNSDLEETEQPLTVSTPLYKHQRQALTFLIRREKGWLFDGPEKDVWSRRMETNRRFTYINTITGQHQAAAPPSFRGGLLADAMGLGKSLSLISLIASDRGNSIILPDFERDTTLKSTKATLVIVPSQLSLDCWVEQLQRHVQPNALSWMVFHGSRRASVDQLLECDIVITTLLITALDWKKSQKGGAASNAGMSIHTVKWHRLILDEAHCIHNRKTIAARAVCAIKSTYKWAVTGTPILNKLQDLGSIFEFLGVYPFSDAKVFNSEIVQPLLHGDAKELTKLRCLVTAISLHRTKSIIDLPNRQDEVHHLDFTLAERRVYDAAMERAAVLFDGQFTKSGPVKSAQYLHGLQFLNQLRLLCNNGQWEPATAKLSMMSEILGREESITWNSGTAQKTFIRLLNAGAATCSNCDEDLMSRAITGNYDPQYRLSKCLMLVCDDCLLNIPKASKDGICSHHPPCPSHWVSINDRDPSPELASVNERRDFDLAKIPTKVSALISNLNEARGQKSVVYSSWQSTLDIIETALRAASISCSRIDGSVTARCRAKVLLQFQTDPYIEVLLMSISASSAATDLTVASRAYLMEPQWNPMAEEQMFRRLHRPGQSREVTTIRYRIRDSIEERIAVVQKRKLAMASLVFTEIGSVKSAMDAH